MGSIKYLHEQKINEMIFIEDVKSSSNNRKAKFKCVCANVFIATISDIKRNQTKSCGCQYYRKKGIEIIKCACGCGNNLDYLDRKGRKKMFIHGHNKGHSIPHTKDSVIKMSLANIGKKIPKEVRLKMGSKKEKNSNWKGGVTSTNELIRKSYEYKEWRQEVFKRDNYTCISCLEKEKVSGKLEADHIMPFAYFPELRFNLDNGRTLCKDCHKKTDTYLVKARIKYGKKFKNHEQNV